MTEFDGEEKSIPIKKIGMQYLSSPGQAGKALSSTAKYCLR